MVMIRNKVGHDIFPVLLYFFHPVNSNNMLFLTFNHVPMNSETPLQKILKQLNNWEQKQFSPFATFSSEAVRRREQRTRGHRQPFAQDADRILHSRAYTRYIDKTQVFSLIDNDHITHRVLHVQIVSRVGRTIGRFLGLNEDLIEAIALGHDIGHPPFGHEGERILSKMCYQFGLQSFQHNIQSIQFLDRFERKGTGWNLTLQTLDGILCHDGEVHSRKITPQRGKTFADLDREIALKTAEPITHLSPTSLEGCVVRLADTISYIGRDIEDAIELKLISRDDIPVDCARLLGTSNGTIVYSLVTDLINNSRHIREAAGQYCEKNDFIGFSQETAEILLELKKFNYERIYRNPTFKPNFKRIADCYEKLFVYYYNKLKNDQSDTAINFLNLRAMSDSYLNEHEPAAIIRDYIAGMTDDYFLRKAKDIGCEIPQRKCLPN
jgi:dGTPase